MIGMIGAVATLIWYFYSAEKAGKSPAKWAVAGALIYAATRWGWTLGVVRPMMGRGFYSHSATTGFLIEISAVIVALIVIVLIRFRFLSSPKD